MREYLVSYNFRTSAGNGVGNIIITASKGPLKSADLPEVINQIKQRPDMANAEIVVMSFSEFAQA